MSNEIPEQNQSGKNTGFLYDDIGKRSSMRLMSFFSLATAIGLAILMVFSVSDCQNENLVLFFLLGAFAPKVFQKIAERWKP